MSKEEQVADTAEADSRAPAPAPVPAPPAPAQEPDWKAESRKWEERAKANKDAAEKLAQLEEAQRKAEQTQAEQLAEAEAKIAAFEQREQRAKWVKEVAETTGVPADALEVVQGSTLEEIQANAERLKPLIAQQQAANLNAPLPAGSGSEPDAHKANIPLKDQIAAAEAAGNRDLVAVLKAAQLGQVVA